MSLTRTTLLMRLPSLDSSSWAQFLEQYKGLIIYLIRIRGVAEDDVGDVLQDVLLRLLNEFKQHNYHKSKGRFRNWLRKIVISATTDWYRRQRRQAASLSTPELIMDEGSGKEETLVGVRAELLKKGLSAVREQTRDATWSCFELHVLQKIPAQDVALQLEMSVNAVYINSSRVMRQVKQYCITEQESSPCSIV